MKHLTQQEYLKQRCCPTCLSEECDVGEIWPEPGTMEQHMTCTACGQVWYEVYVYKRYILGEKDHSMIRKVS